VLKYLKANALCLQSAFQFLRLILIGKVACWSMIGSNDHAAYRAEVKMRAIIIAAAALSLVSESALAQTTRTSPSSSSTSKSIPSSSSTSPNSPCNPTNPTSPCYSANAPRDPCYSAVAPNEPCSTTTTPPPQTSPPPIAPVLPNGRSSAGSAFTADQAKSQVEAAGYSNVSGLRRDSKGIWRGSAVKDGLTVNVTLDAGGKVSTQ
jgi:hypothetical protein